MELPEISLSGSSPSLLVDISQLSVKEKYQALYQ